MLGPAVGADVVLDGERAAWCARVALVDAPLGPEGLLSLGHDSVLVVHEWWVVGGGVLAVELPTRPCVCCCERRVAP